MSNPASLPHPPLAAPPHFLGWRMVGVVFVIDFVATGFFFYSYGIFYPAISADLPGGSLGVAAGISVCNLVSGFSAPLLGRLLDRVPIRRVMLVGTGLVVCGFAALSRVQSLLAYYLVLGSFFALGLGTMGGMASAKLVANWFIRQRGAAFGRATMGVSLSGLVMPLLATWLVSEHGWRVGCLVYALGTLLVVTPLVLRFVISRPEDVGQLPDGRRPQPELPPLPAESERVWSARELLAHGDFWRIAIPFALALSTLSAVLIHLVPHAHELGIGGYRAGWILSASAGCGALGKVCFGSLIDRFDPRRVVWFSFGLQMLGLVLIRATHDYTGLLLGASLFGFSMGGVVPLQGAICGMAFGRQSFGSVMGSMGPVQVPLHAAGIPLLAWIRSASGSYDHAWELGIAVYALAALIVGGLRVRHGAAPVAAPPPI